MSRRSLGILAGAIALGLVAAFFITASATDQPGFCASCHEMQPYVTAWGIGRHRVTSCIDCHVAPGAISRYAHKFVALREVWDHFTSQPRFPLAPPERVPSSWCIRCHRVLPTLPGSRFSHGLHRAVPCYLCHADAGHAVTLASLARAGVLSLSATATPSDRVAPGSAAGHLTIPCERCHPLASTPCSLCHAPPHESRGPCELCHRPGPRWTFTHPRAGEHSFRSFPCAKCHPNGFTTAVCTCHHGRPPKGGD